MQYLLLHNDLICITKYGLSKAFEKYETTIQRLVTPQPPAPGASRAIFMQIKLYCHSKSNGASSLWWLGRSRAKHRNCWGHSAVKWSARQEPVSQIPQISEYDPFDLYGETHWQYIQLAREILPYSWPDMFVDLQIYLLSLYIWSISIHHS